MLTFARLFWEFDFCRVTVDGKPCGVKGEHEDEPPLEEYVLKDHLTGQNEGPILCFRPRW